MLAPLRAVAPRGSRARRSVSSPRRAAAGTGCVVVGGVGGAHVGGDVGERGRTDGLMGVSTGQEAGSRHPLRPLG